MVNLGIVMDPMGSLNLSKDSTLAMIRSAQKRNWNVHCIQQDGLYLEDGEVHATSAQIRLSDGFVEHLDPAAAGDHWYTAAEPIRQPLSAFQIVLMRKDPPFDMEYIYSTYLLERAAEAGVMVVNNPRSIRDCNEKLFATAFPQCQPAVIVSRDPALLKAFHARHEDVVFKPLDGMGGRSIFRARPGEVNLNVIIETLTNFGRTQIMGQRYLPEIRDGDKRVLMIDGEPVPYALARVPMAGETRGNLAAGGTGIGRELNERERWIAAQVGPELRRRGLRFVGLDVIGDWLTEVNVTCPTCIRELDRAFGLDIAGQFLDALEADLA